jgi:hypothetical protein
MHTDQRIKTDVESSVILNGLAGVLIGSDLNLRETFCGVWLIKAERIT